MSSEFANYQLYEIGYSNKKFAITITKKAIEFDHVWVFPVPLWDKFTSFFQQKMDISSYIINGIHHLYHSNHIYYIIFHCVGYHSFFLSGPVVCGSMF